MNPSVGPRPAAPGATPRPDTDEVVKRQLRTRLQRLCPGLCARLCYMGLVEPELAAPRLSTPRKKVQRARRGDAERQTAILSIGVTRAAGNLAGS